MNITITGLICPDAGAERRTSELNKLFNVPITYARKKRDSKTGALSGFHLDPLPEAGAYLIADDICDGGGTFIGLAQEYRKDPKGIGALFLWVTHGIFSKGVDELLKHFAMIGTTDSFPSDTIKAPYPLVRVTAIREGISFDRF
jgi:ribose-phosphate pyrophosphokinase